MSEGMFFVDANMIALEPFIFQYLEPQRGRVHGHRQPGRGLGERGLDGPHAWRGEANAEVDHPVFAGGRSADAAAIGR